MNELQHQVLKLAASRPDGTVLAIGYNRHGGYIQSVPKATAIALERRGLLALVTFARWGTVYRITDAGRKALTA